ncbi:MAG: hemolysin family protein [Candidatus Methanomethylophilaceae archaeon]|jgi:CBS domain containing-hemolysin-like protein|nr:hemolysin family protein [Candidatus Methanomethylophilaceae archaeon]NCA73882.1 HlyC/CorC family transporter [Gammaproteobacteria bacterium]MDD3351905.1 hemolysin family protein [Candidatus Methanomethylophilaceae archaeon]MDD3987232.1 hemolysin family protein [Candidatus Methanomethylophilaceae archaeon]MDD4708651.1 hemolysin family protein [Candidatus Methanomethylophilaceae archaeon]
MDVGLVAILSVIIIVLLFGAVYFSMSEMAYSSVNNIRLKKLECDGSKSATRALALSEDFERLLTTILVGNNILNIAASTTCTMLFTQQLFPDSPALGTVVATVFMTMIILTFGEIAPKNIAKRRAEHYALKLAGSLTLAVTVLTPITWFFIKLSSVFTKESKKKTTLTLTEDELVVMIDEIEEEGTLEKTESDLIKSAITFDDTPLSEVYIPRVDIMAASKDINMDELKELFTYTGYSRIPIYDGSIDRIIGVVNAKDFFRRVVNNDNFNLIDIIRQVKFFQESTSIAEVLNTLQKTKVHMAVVLDSFGGTLGIVTLEDIIEELVGEIWDESDDVKLPVVREADGSYTVIGDANIYNVMDDLGLKFDPEDYVDYNVSGYIQYKIEDIPYKGAVVDNDNVKITVKSIKGRRVKEARFDIKEVQAPTGGES